MEVAESGNFYMTVDGDLPESSNCTQLWGRKNWVGFLIEKGNQSQQEIMTMASFAYNNGSLVDIGAFAGSCIDDNAPVAKFDYIRVGNYR